ncbi:MAG: ATP-binding cassette domain-containing protein [Actinomycetota bacterium]
MASVEFANVTFGYSTGPPVLNEVSFKVSDGDHSALVGANGAGKTTIMKLIAGELSPNSGDIGLSGSWKYMSQMIGIAEGLTLRELYLSLSPPEFIEAAAALARAEERLTTTGGDPDQAEKVGVAYANALGRWEAIGGYDLENLWAECADRAVGLPWTELADRSSETFSGGEQKRLALELLFRADYDLLLLDEPDNFLDVPGKNWLADRLNDSQKTILYISHDRELLATTSRKVITIEAKGGWTHGASFATWPEARQARLERIDDENRRWDEERQRLQDIVKELKRRASFSETFAPKAKAAESRLRQFEERGRPPERIVEQQIDMQLTGDRTGKRAVMVDQLELIDLTFPFDDEIWFGDRVAVVGLNGTGKSHFLRLLAGQDVAHEGAFKLGANVVPGLFSQTHEHPELKGRTLNDILLEDHLNVQLNARGRVLSYLKRYELHHEVDQTWDSLSGGQQARFQILLLELSGATLLLLDEPTDNLDVASAEALEKGLGSFKGTVISVSHDRWFLRSFDRFLVFDPDGEVHHADAPDRAWT